MSNNFLFSIAAQQQQQPIAHLTQSCDLGTETHEMKCFRIGIELSHTSRKILSRE